MPSYLVTWEINIDADTPGCAAEEALAVQRDPTSTATVFKVTMCGPCPKCHQQLVHLPRCSVRRQQEKMSGVGGPQCVDYVHHIDVVKNA